MGSHLGEAAFAYQRVSPSPFKGEGKLDIFMPRGYPKDSLRRNDRIDAAVTAGRFPMWKPPSPQEETEPFHGRPLAACRTMGNFSYTVGNLHTKSVPREH